MLIWKGDDIIRQFQKAADNTEEELLKEILKRSQENVPVKTGRLKESGHIDESTSSVVYDADYAATVHEDPESNGYKFLESATKEVINLKMLQSTFKRELK